MNQDSAIRVRFGDQPEREIDPRHSMFPIFIEGCEQLTERGREPAGPYVGLRFDVATVWIGTEAENGRKHWTEIDKAASPPGIFTGDAAAPARIIRFPHRATA